MTKYIIIAIIFTFVLFGLSGCGLGPTEPSDSITLSQVGPYKYTDGHLIWEYCSYPESEPSRSLCGICHWIY